MFETLKLILPGLHGNLEFYIFKIVSGFCMLHFFKYILFYFILFYFIFFIANYNIQLMNKLISQCFNSFSLMVINDIN